MSCVANLGADCEGSADGLVAYGDTGGAAITDLGRCGCNAEEIIELDAKPHP